jgi:hypothetical protein
MFERCGLFRITEILVYIFFLFQTLEVQVTNDNMPELDELFEIKLASAVADDGIPGSTNSSGASIDPAAQSSQVTLEANDFPFGLLQFSSKVGVPPTPGSQGMIVPATVAPVVSIDIVTVCLLGKCFQSRIAIVYRFFTRSEKE